MPSQGANPARPARRNLKALHMPQLGESNSLLRRGFGGAESNHVGHIDSTVLQVCYATDSGRL